MMTSRPCLICGDRHPTAFHRPQDVDEGTVGTILAAFATIIMAALIVGAIS